LRYFIGEILPLLQAELTGMTLTVVGEVPRHELNDLDLGNVIFTGYLQDLRPLFEQALVYIAPLRFGAGIKGKILDAMNFGVPVVTTSIGAEGIGLTDKEDVLIADTAIHFGTAVMALHNDSLLWEGIRNRARQYVEKNFSQDAFIKRVEKVMTKLL
jgi:glycosyltransferase involved in cell wall biosynthesis